MTLRNAVLVQTKDTWMEAVDDDSVTTYRRRETMLALGAYSDPATVALIMERVLDIYANPREQITVGVDSHADVSKAYPFYRAGDLNTVLDSTEASVTEDVQSVTINVDNKTGLSTETVVVKDQLQELDEEYMVSIQKMARGVIVGSAYVGAMPAVTERLVPSRTIQATPQPPVTSVCFTESWNGADSNGNSIGPDLVWTAAGMVSDDSTPDGYTITPDVAAVKTNKLTFDGSGFVGGDYQTTIRIMTNDSIAQDVSVQSTISALPPANDGYYELWARMDGTLGDASYPFFGVDPTHAIGVRFKVSGSGTFIGVAPWFLTDDGLFLPSIYGPGSGDGVIDISSSFPASVSPGDVLKMEITGAWPNIQFDIFINSTHFLDGGLGLTSSYPASCVAAMLLGSAPHYASPGVTGGPISGDQCGLGLSFEPTSNFSIDPTDTMAFDDFEACTL